MKKSPEDLIRNLESTCADIYDQMSDIIYIADRSGCTLYMNEAGYKTLETTPEALIGKPLDHWIHPGDVAECRERIGTILDQGSDFFEFESRCRTASGKVIPVVHTGRVIPGEQGEPVAVQAVARDISGQKQREIFVQNVLDNVDEGFIIVDRDFRIISANRAYCEQSRQDCDTIVGHRCFEVSHKLDRPCHEAGEECPTKYVFETGEPYACMHKHYGSDGSVLYVEVKSFPVKDLEGRIFAAVEIVHNITERRRLEEQLIHAQKMEAVGQLAGGIAHDFNNILNAIMGYSDMVLMRMPPDDPLREYLEQILASSQRANKLTKNLLAFSRKQIINPRLLDLNEVVGASDSLLRRLIREDIEFAVMPAEHALSVMVDDNQVEQILMNLVANARDAMPDGGKLVIATGVTTIDDRFRKIHGYGGSGSYALVTVSDTGTGMDEQTREKIFEPFFTTKDTGKGTGLGLAMVYGIMKQHGGYVDVYSEPGSGSVFKLYFPLVDQRVASTVQEARAADTAASSGGMQGGSETILVAEDDIMLRKLTTDVLEKFGYRVIPADDGQAAVDLFNVAADPVDLLLLDVMMPRMNGKEALHEIRKKQPGIKALFMSGYTANLIHKQGILEKGTDFIFKPVSIQDLLRKVREVLDSR